MIRAPLLIAVLACCSSGESNERQPLPEALKKDAAAKKEQTEPAPSPADVVTEEDGAKIGLSLLGRYKDPAFGAAGLPGLSPDGTRIAYAEELLDGGRGNPNFRLVIRDTANDRPVVKKEILSPATRFSPDDEPLVRGRIDEANQLLAETEWKPMNVMSVSDDDGVFAHDNIDVAIRGASLVVRQAGVAKLRRPLVALLSKNPSCVGKPEIAEAYVADRRILVRFQFETDGCWREAETHALRIR